MTVLVVLSTKKPIQRNNHRSNAVRPMQTIIKVNIIPYSN